MNSGKVLAKVWEQQVYVPQLPTRVFIIIAAALANCLSYVYRTNMSVTIVAMVNHTSVHPLNRLHLSNPCTELLTLKHDTKSINGPFNWDETLQGHILGAYYYGYILTNLQGGYFANKFRPRALCALVTLIASVLTILTPFVTQFGPIPLIVLRVVTGLCQGVLTPALYSLLSYWIPRNERSLALALIQVGGYIGAILTTVLSGILCSTLGWQSVFYISGTFGIFCLLVWCWTVYNTPVEHPRISDAEVSTIRLNVDVSDMSASSKQTAIPWRQIAFSMPVWAISIAKFCGAWGNLMLMSKLPSYLQTVLHVTITQNGYITSVVYVGLSVSLTVFGIVSDRVEQRKYLSKTALRKLFECSALIGPAICLVLVPGFSCNIQYLVVLLVLAMVLFGLNAGGEKPIVVEVAPDHSGTVYGVTNAIGSLPGIFAPILVGLMTSHSASVHEGWNRVFYSASGIYIFGAIFFALFATAKTQPWGIISVTKADSPSSPSSQSPATTVSPYKGGRSAESSRRFLALLNSTIDRIQKLKHSTSENVSVNEDVSDPAPEYSSIDFSSTAPLSPMNRI